jgi:hypothetical protein
MLNFRSVLVFGALLLGEGCAKKESSAQLLQAHPPASSLTTNVSPRLDASSAQAPAPPSPLQPLAEGKRVRINKLWGPPVEITVPPDFKLRMEGGVESNPEANLEGPEWSVVVLHPEAGFFTLKQEKDILIRSDPLTKVILERETADGFVLIDQNSIDGPSKYSATVSRRALDVECGAWGLNSLADAEKAASICLTLGPGRGRGKRH